jgi:hypothetical protein
MDEEQSESKRKPKRRREKGMDYHSR